MDLPSPAQSVSANGSVTVTVEVAALNYTSAMNGTHVYLPSLTASFPLGSGGTFQVYLSPKTVSLSGASWSSVVGESRTKAFGSAMSFSTTGNAHLSSSKIAVMAPAAYGTLTLEFRWQWTVLPQSGGTPASSAWTVPSKTATSPDRPSIFAPALYSAVVSTSPQPARAGSNFTVALSGSVSNTSFRVVVEYPNNGTEITSHWESSSPGVSGFNATAPLQYSDGSALRKGTYLLHIHDVCNAIVHSLSVSVSGPLVLTAGVRSAAGRGAPMAGAVASP